MQPVIRGYSNDGKRHFVTPDGDATRGTWVEVEQPLETIQFPSALPPLPKLYAAPWGAGKGVRGGAAALQRHAQPVAAAFKLASLEPVVTVPKGYTDPATFTTAELQRAIAYARLEADEGTPEMQKDVRVWLALAEAELARREDQFKTHCVVSANDCYDIVVFAGGLEDCQTFVSTVAAGRKEGGLNYPDHLRVSIIADLLPQPYECSDGAPGVTEIVWECAKPAI